MDVRRCAKKWSVFNKNRGQISFLRFVGDYLEMQRVAFRLITNLDACKLTAKPLPLSIFFALSANNRASECL